MRHVVLDCDPGHDDAIAILMLLADPEIQVDGISVVAGNQTLDKTVRNALQVLTVAGRADVPVYAGMPGPMARELVTAAHVHGQSGLDGPDLPPPSAQPAPTHAVEWLSGHLAASTEPIDVVATGPLSNLGMVLRQDPALAGKIRRLVVMGGAVGEGNITPSAEFNIYVDPEAARTVFDAGAPLTMIGLDVTHRAMLYRPDIERLRAIGGSVATMAADLLAFVSRFHLRRYGVDGTAVHDACAVAALRRPDLLSTRRLRVDVETRGAVTDGRTVVDLWGVTERAPNVDVGLDIDRDAFVAMLEDDVARLSAGIG